MKIIKSNTMGKRYSQKLPDYYTEKIASNPNTNPEILRKILERGNNDLVSGYAAENPNCPPDALRMVLERGNNDLVSGYAAENPNCPPDALRMVLERGNNEWVSRRAAKNPNCPPYIKVKWMRDTGKIEKEDPSKHIIEYEDEKPDEDLEKLRSLISTKKFNLKRYSQKLPDYYTEEIAEDPNTSPEILRKILERGNDDGVSQFAAKNSNCPPDALRMVLERGKDDYVSRYAAENPNCPPDLLRMVLERGNDDWVSQFTVKNPNCPPDLLRMVLERGNDDWVSRYAARNPNCPPDLLRMVLERGNDDLVSQYAAENSNCPFDIKVKWMRDTGKIEKEDPSKHIIEYEEEKPDEDLEKLRSLISTKKFNLKRYSQKLPDYYTKKVAKDPNTSPDLLRTVLERGNDDIVSQYAVLNLNCPPDALRMVLERGNNDWVSQYAANNPNCPPDALRMVLERGNNNGVSQQAALNPNCPPDALRMVLERGNNDWVSQYAANNPNCPFDIKVKWMRDTGKIEKEDPSKHIIEYEDEKPDEDLEKLRSLISENNHSSKELPHMTTKIQKIALSSEDIPDSETLGAYIDAIQLYYKDNPNMDNVVADQINRLPSPRKVRMDYSEEECKLLFENISYIWRKITNQDIIEESKIIRSEDAFCGNYWLIKNGVMLEGVNHYSIIKQNSSMFSTLLNVNGFALQHYLSSNPNKVIDFIIKNGGIRVLIRKDNKGYFQLSEETYANWGKDKIRSFDLREKIVKIVDFKVPYQGWKSGINIKL